MGISSIKTLLTTLDYIWINPRGAIMKKFFLLTFIFTSFPCYAQSTIDPDSPTQKAVITSGLLRNQFRAAYNDVNALYGLTLSPTNVDRFLNADGGTGFIYRNTNGIYSLASPPTFTFPQAGIPVSTGSGWADSVADNSTNWNAAYTNRIMGVSATLPMSAVVNPTTRALAISIPKATSSFDGYLSRDDWSYFSSKLSSVPTPNTATLGGLYALESSNNKFVTYIGSDGVQHQSTITASNVSGLGSLATANTVAVNVSGDATGSASVPTQTLNLTLANSGVTAGSYGGSTNIPVITVNSKGLITGVSTTPTQIFSFPSAGLVASTGTSWGASVTDNSANWNTAFTKRLEGVSATSPLTLTLNSNVLSGSISKANSTTSGYLSNTDWVTFNSKVTSEVDPLYTASSWYTTTNNATNWDAAYSSRISSVSSTQPLSMSVLNGVLSASITQASASYDGYLSSTDWANFNSKQNHITTGSTSQYLDGTLSLRTFPTALSNFTNDLGYLTKASATFSGDVTGSGQFPGSVVLTMANSGATSGTYGSTSQIPVITVNSKGVVTSASSVAVPSQSYPTAGLALSTGTGWGTSVTDNSANWNSAYTNRITGVVATAPAVASISSNSLNVSIIKATATQDGYLTKEGFAKLNSALTAETDPVYTASSWFTTTNNATNWNSAYTNRITAVSASLPLSMGLSANSLSASISKANSTTDGYLSKEDWATFNGKLSANQQINLTGAVTGYGTTNISTTLSPIGVTAGTYGGGSSYPIITVNDAGQVTGVSTISLPDNTFTFPMAGIPLSTGTGWSSSITNNSANWNTAYTKRLESATGTSPLVLSLGSNALTGSILKATATQDGYVSKEDWATFNSKISTETDPIYSASSWASTSNNSTNWNAAYTYRLTSANGSGPLTLTLSNNSLTGSLLQATATTSGFLSNTDWATFNGKLSANQTITLSGDVTGSGSTAITTTLPTTGVTAGSYGSSLQVPIVTVNAKGLVTGMSTASVASMTYPAAGIAVSTGSAWGTSITNNSTNWNTAYSKRLDSASGTAPLTLTLTGNALTGSLLQATSTTSGYLSNTDWVTFNSKQAAITTGTTAQYFDGTLALKTFPTKLSSFTNDSGFITSAAATFTGDVTGTGTLPGSIALTLADRGITEGTYGSFSAIPSLTINSRGVITGVSTVAIQSSNWDSAYTKRIDSVSATAPLVLSLSSNVLSGSIPKATSSVNGYLSSTDWTTFNSKLSANQTITLSGDATGSGTTSIPVTLANSGVTAGSYGNATTVPIVTVNAKGLVTGVSTATISAGTTCDIRLATSSASVSALSTDCILEVGSSSSAVTVTLPASPAAKQIITIKDGVGSAGSKNITIRGNGKTIDGQTSYPMYDNWASITMYYNGTSWRIK